jgi:hypothetical protein
MDAAPCLFLDVKGFRWSCGRQHRVAKGFQKVLHREKKRTEIFHEQNHPMVRAPRDSAIPGSSEMTPKALALPLAGLPDAGRW